MEPRPARLSLQQVPYSFKAPANVYYEEKDKLVQSDLKLTSMHKPMLKPILKAPPQSTGVRFQFDPSINPRMKEISFRDPSFLAVLNEQAKKMTDHGWKFDPVKHSEPVPRHHSSPEIELNTVEADWLKNYKLSQVIKERRARQAATAKSKQLLPWETNDVNTEDCELFNHASLDEELNAFYGLIGEYGSNTPEVPINNYGDVDDNTANWVAVPPSHPFQTENSMDFDVDPHESFIDSAISVDDQFPATASTATGDFYPDELDQFSEAAFTREDSYATNLDISPPASPTFPIQETSEEDRDFVRSLYCNTGMDNEFLDAPYDLEDFATDGVNHSDGNGTQNQYASYDPDSFATDGVNHSEENGTQNQYGPYDPAIFATDGVNHSDENGTQDQYGPYDTDSFATDGVNHSEENGTRNQYAPYDTDSFATGGANHSDENGTQNQYASYDADSFATDAVNYSDENGTQNQYVGSLYNPESLPVHDPDETYVEKMHYTVAFPDHFLRFNNPPAAKKIVKPGQVNNNPAGTIQPDASLQVNAPDVSQQSLATSNQDATRSPDRSAAVGNQLLTDLQSDANFNLGNLPMAPAPSVRAESESSLKIILSPPSVRRRKIHILSDYDSDSEHDDSNDSGSDDSVELLPLPSPIHLKRDTITANRLAHDRLAAASNGITNNKIELLKLPIPPVVPSTPRKRSHSDMQSDLPDDKFFNPVTGTRVNVASYYGSYQTLTTPVPSTPTTPRTPGYSSLAPYQSSYSYATSPTPNGPRITTVLHGQVISTPPKTYTPEVEPTLKAQRLARKFAATKAAAAKQAADKIAAAKEAADKEAADKEAADEEAANEEADYSSSASEQPVQKRVRRSVARQ